MLSDSYNNKEDWCYWSFICLETFFVAWKASLKNILPLSFSWDAIQTPQPSFELASKGNVWSYLSFNLTKCSSPLKYTFWFMCDCQPVLEM